MFQFLNNTSINTKTKLLIFSLKTTQNLCLTKLPSKKIKKNLQKKFQKKRKQNPFSKTKMKILLIKQKKKLNQMKIFLKMKRIFFLILIKIYQDFFYKIKCSLNPKTKFKHFHIMKIQYYWLPFVILDHLVNIQLQIY